MPPSPPRVLVLGGGVAGLSAAHELAARGYQVHVYERAALRVGGLAATQYASRPAAPGASSASREAPGVGDATPPNDALAGEHGFRFFPSFYRHLTDVMRRTPVLMPDGPNWRDPEDRRTCADNLIPTTLVGYAVGDGMVEHTYQRTETRLVDLIRFIRDYLATAGLEGEDIARVQLATIEYATSCESRRRDLENVSWWNFVRGYDLSPAGQLWLTKTPEALVAMDAHECDVRTYGTVSIQMMLDQMSDGSQTDRTLNGPSSEAWLDPWRRFMRERLGVTFHGGWEVKELVTMGGVLEAVKLRNVASNQVRTRSHGTHWDYVVCALSIEGAARVLTDSGFTAASPGDVGQLLDFHSLAGFGQQSGIQYFLKERVEFVRGHIYCPASEWGLSAISQGQFWREDIAAKYAGVGSIISVDIGVWDEPGNGGSLPKARHCTREVIAEEVWRQLRVATAANPASLMGSVVTPRHPLPPTPAAWHLDDAVVLDTSVAPPEIRNANLLINRPTEWAKRPGRLADNTVHYPEQDYRRELGGRLVFCGTYMKTYTRLTTMEAANESARHAVNAILRADNYPGDACTIWPTDRWEIPELDSLIAWDRDLYNSGRPHFLRIIHAREWLDVIMG